MCCKSTPQRVKFVLNEKNAAENDELFFCAAGSGITPFIAMAKAARQANADRKITLLHVVQNAEKQMLKQKVEELKEKYNVNVNIYFTQDAGNKLYDAEQPQKPSAAFYALLDKVMAKDVKQDNVYIVGPKAFGINAYVAMMKHLNCDGNGLRYEAFGPFPSFELLAAKEAAAEKQ